MLRRSIAAAVLLAASAAPATGGDRSQRYITEGQANIQICRGFGVELCEYSAVAIPTYIDQAKRKELDAVWHEDKGDFIMCYEELERGIFTKKLLMFRCTPLD